MINVRKFVEKRKENTQQKRIWKQTNLVEQLFGLTVIHFVLFIVMMCKELVKEILQQGINTILAEPMVDHVYDETFPMSEKESDFSQLNFTRSI